MNMLGAFSVAATLQPINLVPTYEWDIHIHGDSYVFSKRYSRSGFYTVVTDDGFHLSPNFGANIVVTKPSGSQTIEAHGYVYYGVDAYQVITENGTDYVIYRVETNKNDRHVCYKVDSQNEYWGYPGKYYFCADVLINYDNIKWNSIKQPNPTLYTIWRLAASLLAWIKTLFLG